MPNQDDSYKVGNKEGSHLQLCLLHNVVIDTVSDKQVNKHNVGGVDEGNVLQVKVRLEFFTGSFVFSNKIHRF